MNGAEKARGMDSGIEPDVTILLFLLIFLEEKTGLRFLGA
jgi:hypothetical protein